MENITFDGRQAYDRYLAAVAQDARWGRGLRTEFLRAPEALLLDPTPRSKAR